MTFRVMVSCPPMLAQLEQLEGELISTGWEVTTPEFTQTLSVPELCELVPQHDGWIIGDDPANAEVITAGVRGRLKAAVKWGVGTDNIDFEAFAKANIPITHTPAMFGNEVADIALGYVIALARHTFEIHSGVLNNQWPKPSGISLLGKTCGVVGFGDIGRQLSQRLVACGLQVVAYDPYVDAEVRANATNVEFREWPDQLNACDFLCFTCALTDANRHMFDDLSLAKVKPGVRIVNVARGPLIRESALIDGLTTGRIAAAALDVFESEPLATANALRKFPQNIFGSHNASNTIDAVLRTSRLAIELLQRQLR